MEHTVRWNKSTVAVRFDTFSPGTFGPAMAKLEQISIVVSEGEVWLGLIHSSTRAMFGQCSPGILLSPGEVSITKCQEHCEGIGMGSGEIGAVCLLLGWDRWWIIDNTMMEVEIIIIVTGRLGNINHTATSIGDIKRTATNIGDMIRLVIPGWRPHNTRVLGTWPRTTHVPGTWPWNTVP